MVERPLTVRWAVGSVPNGGLIELFLVPASVTCPWHVLSYPEADLGVITLLYIKFHPPNLLTVPLTFSLISCLPPPPHPQLECLDPPLLSVYKRYFTQERVAHVVPTAGFLSRCLNGSLPYIQRHITIYKLF